MSKRKLDDNNATEDRSAKLAADVKGLNTAFASWVSAQSKDKLAFFWEKACQDYIAHVKSLKEEYADVLSAKKQAPEPAKASAPALTFAPPSSTTTTTTTTTPSFPLFGSAPPATSSPPASAPAPTFSFGNTAATAGQSTTGSAPAVFGVTSSSSGAGGSAATPNFMAAPPGGFTGFSFGSSSAPSFPPAATSSGPAAGDADGADGEAEEDGGEKFDSKVQKDETTTTLFQANAKVHVKLATGSWETRGTGSLTVRESKAAKRPFVLLSTDAGRALLTASVPKGCKPNVPAQENANDKVRVRKLLVGMLVAAQEKDGGGPPKLMTLMISVANAEKRDELHRLLMRLGAEQA